MEKHRSWISFLLTLTIVILAFASVRGQSPGPEGVTVEHTQTSDADQTSTMDSNTVQTSSESTTSVIETTTMSDFSHDSKASPVPGGNQILSTSPQNDSELVVTVQPGNSIDTETLPSPTSTDNVMSTAMPSNGATASAYSISTFPDDSYDLTPSMVPSMTSSLDSATTMTSSSDSSIAPSMDYNSTSVIYDASTPTMEGSSALGSSFLYTSASISTNETTTFDSFATPKVPSSELQPSSHTAEMSYMVTTSVDTPNDSVHVVSSPQPDSTPSDSVITSVPTSVVDSSVSVLPTITPSATIASSSVIVTAPIQSTVPLSATSSIPVPASTTSVSPVTMTVTTVTTPPEVTTVPLDPPVRTLILSMTLSGNCSMLGAMEAGDNLTEFKNKFIAVLSQELDFPASQIRIKSVSCGSVIVVAHFINVTSVADLEDSLVAIQNAPTNLFSISNNTFVFSLIGFKRQEDSDDDDTIAQIHARRHKLTEVQMIIIIVCSVIGGTLVIYAVGFCFYACYQRRKKSKSFALGVLPVSAGNNVTMNMDDFTITKMQRGPSSYNEYGVVVPAAANTKSKQRHGKKKGRYEAIEDDIHSASTLPRRTVSMDGVRGYDYNIPHGGHAGFDNPSYNNHGNDIKTGLGNHRSLDGEKTRFVPAPDYDQNDEESATAF